MTAPAGYEVGETTANSTSGRAKPKGMNAKQYLEFLLGRGKGELEGQLYQFSRPEGYYGKRMSQGDVSYDELWDTLLPQQMRDLNESRDRKEFQFEGQDPAGGPGWNFDMAGPEAGDWGDYLARARAGGQIGNTTEGDLSRYADPSFYFQAMRDGGGMGGSRPPDIDSPDFEGMFSRYADAANNRFRQTLSDETASLTGSAVGRGRVATGFLDEDYGTLASRLSRESRDDVNSRAIDVLGLQAGDTDSRRRYALGQGEQALTGANLSLRAGDSARDAAFESASNARSNREEARGRYEDDRDTGERRFQDRRDTSRRIYEDDRDTGEQRFQDRRGFARDVFEDAEGRVERGRDFRGNQANNLLRLGQSRSRDAYDRYQDQMDRYYDALFGTTDRAQGQYNAQQQRKNDMWSGIWGGLTKLGAAAVGAG